MAGGGALLGTGAFSTVEAERTATVETADDAGGFLGLWIRDDLAAEGETIGLDFGDRGLNRNFESEFHRTLLIRNQGTQDGIDVAFDYEIAGRTNGAEEIFQFVPNPEPGTFDDGEGGIEVEGEPPLDAGEAAAYDLVVDLRRDRLSGAAREILDSVDIDSFEVTTTVRAGPDVGDDPADGPEQVGLDIEIDGDRSEATVEAGEVTEYAVYRLFEDGSETRLFDREAVSIDPSDPDAVSIDPDTFELTGEDPGDVTVTATESDPESDGIFEGSIDLTVAATLPDGAVAFRDADDDGVYGGEEETYTADDLRDLDVDDPIVVARDVTNDTWPAFDIDADKLTIQEGVSVISEGGEITIEAGTGGVAFEEDSELIAENGGAEVEVTASGDVAVNTAELRSVAEMTIEADGDLLADTAAFETTGGGDELTLSADGDVVLENSSAQSVAPLSVSTDGALRADGADFETTGGGSDVTLTADGAIELGDAAVESVAPISIEADGDLSAPGVELTTTGGGSTVSIETDGSVGIDGGSVAASGEMNFLTDGLLTGEGAAIDAVEIAFDAEGAVALPGASVASEREFEIQTEAGIDVEGAALSAENDWVTITAELGGNEQFVVSDAEFTAAGEPTDVEYSPASVTIVGEPAVGGTTL